MRSRWALLSMLGVALLLLASCQGEETGGSDDDGVLRVVTTVSPITSLAENIAGTQAIVTGIVPEGTNSHTFEPKPSVARTLAQADLIIVNGLQLEEPSLRLAEANKQAGTPIVRLGDQVLQPGEWVYDFSFPREGGKPNPHLWLDPLLARRYAEIIAARMTELDPANASYYQRNLATLVSRIDALDAAIRASAPTVPARNRRLLTYHDSWPYFARRYGFEVIGAAQPADFSEPSPREVARIIDQINASGVPAVFGSEVFPSTVLRTISQETGAKYIDQLRDDDLPGSPGDSEHSYVGLMRSNMQTMLGTLGGSTDAFKDLDVRLVFEGKSLATYPQ